MITVLTGLIGSKYGKYILEIAIVAGLVFGAYKWAESRGKAAQKDSDEQKQTQDIEKERQAAQAANNIAIQQLKDAATQADARAQQAQAQFASLAGLLQGLAVKESAAKQQVSSLSDSQLHSDVLSKLPPRPVGTLNACYLPSEERVIDDAITQYPLCQQDKQALTGQVSALQDKVTAREDKISDLNQILIHEEAYTSLVESDYKKLFDMHPPRYRSVKCVFLWKCGKKKVDFATVLPTAVKNLGVTK